MAAKTGTYTLINSTTLSTSATSVTFSSIPGTYTDLAIVTFAGNTTVNAYDILVTFNSDTGSNYSRTRLYGNGTSAVSTRDSNVSNIVVGSMNGSASTNGFSVGRYNINDYANTTTYKTMLVRQDTPGSTTFAIVGLWRSTAAITSITFTPEAPSNIASGSTFKLYGIEAGNL